MTIDKVASYAPRWMRGKEGRKRQNRTMELINTHSHTLNASQQTALVKGLTSTLSLWQGSVHARTLPE